MRSGATSHGLPEPLGLPPLMFSKQGGARFGEVVARIVERGERT